MTLKTKKCKKCEKIISSPTRIPICDSCRNTYKHWALGLSGLALLGLIKTQTDKKN